MDGIEESTGLEWLGKPAFPASSRESHAKAMSWGRLLLHIFTSSHPLSLRLFASFEGARPLLTTLLPLFWSSKKTRCT